MLNMHQQRLREFTRVVNVNRGSGTVEDTDVDTADAYLALESGESKSVGG